MAVAVVQNDLTSNATGSATPSDAFGSTPTVGNLGIFTGSWATFTGTPGAGSCHDSASHNATQGSSNSSGNAGGTFYTRKFASGDTATWTFVANGDEASIVGLELSGQDATTALDAATPTWKQTASTVASLASNTYTPTSAAVGGLAVLILVTDNAGVTFSALSGWTLQVTATGAGHFHGAAIYTRNTAISSGDTTSGISATPSWTGNTSAAANVILFIRPASGGGATTGTSAQTLPTLTQAASGTESPPSFTGTSAQTLPNLTQSAAGTEAPPDFIGTSALTLPGLTQAASGSESPPDTPSFFGGAAQTLPSLTQAGDGAATPPDFIGTSALTLPPLAQAGDGAVQPPLFTGTAAQTLPSLGQLALGDAEAPAFDGTMASTLAALTQAAFQSPPLAPACRTLTIAAETRALIVAAEIRAVDIAAETRDVEVTC